MLSDYTKLSCYTGFLQNPKLRCTLACGGHANSQICTDYEPRKCYLGAVVKELVNVQRLHAVVEPFETWSLCGCEPASVDMLCHLRGNSVSSIRSHCSK